MKNVTNAGSSVKNQLSRAKAKWRKLGLTERPRIVITTDRCTDSFESVTRSVMEKGGYAEVIVVSEQELVRITK